MAASSPPYTKYSPQIRPFDVRSDMLAVSDLVEVCFAERLSPDGEALLKKMRSSARSKRFQRWAYTVAGRVSMPFTGFVWIENQRIVGNLSLIPYHLARKDYYMIANIAVHPEYQRQGIGRALVRRALDFLSEKNLDGIWLQVEEENQGAVDLYLQEGFQERSRRTTWILNPENQEGLSRPGGDLELGLVPRRGAHWPQQRSWLKASYPPEVRWHLPLKLRYLRGGFWGAVLNLFLSVPALQHWAVAEGDRLRGVFTWQKSKSYADWLWIAAPPESEDDLLKVFLPRWRSYSTASRPLRINYPRGRASLSLLRHGFSPTRTLIWMQYAPQRERKE